MSRSDAVQLERNVLIFSLLRFGKERLRILHHCTSIGSVHFLKVTQYSRLSVRSFVLFKIVLSALFSQRRSTRTRACGFAMVLCFLGDTYAESRSPISRLKHRELTYPNLLHLSGRQPRGTHSIASVSLVPQSFISALDHACGLGTTTHSYSIPV